ncbi:MAG: hypothetical protein HOJ35_04325 [Bdellovibrionales bacterium]|nr:hypothetical protein [Bdellovibrionales bacterium]
MNILKTILCIAVIYFSLSSYGSEDYESLVLETVDNICGDSWCEGDFDFEFLEFKLSESEKQAKLQFVLILETNGQYLIHTAKCNLKGYTKISEIIEKETRYNRYNLTDRYYEELSLCIADEEEKFRNILDFSL